MQSQHAQLRGEARGLVLPVGDQAGGHHDQRRCSQAPGLFLGEHMGEGLHGFAQAHVIGQHTAHAQLTQGLHPGQAFQLIRTQGREQAAGRADSLLRQLLQATGEVSQLLAAMPVQGRALGQGLQACGIGTGQAQRLAAGQWVTEEQLAEGRQQRLQTGKGQADAAFVRQADG